MSEAFDLDLERTARRGYPEAVFCAGKTAAQVAAIAATVRGRPDVTTLDTLDSCLTLRDAMAAGRSNTWTSLAVS